MAHNTSLCGQSLKGKFLTKLNKIKNSWLPGHCLKDGWTRNREITLCGLTYNENKCNYVGP